MSSPATGRRASFKDSWGSLVIVGLVSLIFGLVILPRLGGQGLEEGAEAPAFTLPVIGGDAKELSLQQFEGKPVVLDFWASWCAPCKAQVPVLDRVAAKYAKAGLVTLGVNTQDDPMAAQRFLEANQVGYESVLDVDGSAAEAYGVTGLPTLVIVDRKGQVMTVRRRLVDEQELTELVEEALAS